MIWSTNSIELVTSRRAKPNGSSLSLPRSSYTFNKAAQVLASHLHLLLTTHNRTLFSSRDGQFLV